MTLVLDFIVASLGSFSEITTCSLTETLTTDLSFQSTVF